VTVDDGGVISGVSSGSADITAAASGFSDELSVSVSAAPAPTPSSSPSSSSSSSSSSDDDEDEPEEEPEPEPEVEEEEEDSAAVDDTAEEDDPEPVDEDDGDDEDEPIQSAPIITPTRVVGGGTAAVGSYVAAVALSRSELFVSTAPVAVTKAMASVPGTAGTLLAEPEQAAFVVSSVTLAVEDDDSTGDSEVDIEPGELLAVEATIENKGDIPGARVISMSLDEREDDTPLDLAAHTAKAVTLEYQTTAADAGKTLGFTISCETDSADIDITVGDQPPEDDSMSETPTPDDHEDDTDEPAAGSPTEADQEVDEAIDEDTDEESNTDTDEDDGEVVDPDEVDENDEIDAEAEEDELDAGTRTGLVDRLWMQKGKILSYTAGLIIIYIGLTNIADNVFAGGLGIFLGVMALPIVRAQLPTSTRVLISRYGKVVVVIIAALFSGVLIDPAVVFDTIGGLLP